MHRFRISANGCNFPLFPSLCGWLLKWSGSLKKENIVSFGNNLWVSLCMLKEEFCFVLFSLIEPKILFDAIYFWSVLRNSADWAILKLFRVIRACGGLVPSQHVRTRENILYFKLPIYKQKETDKAIWLCLAPVWITVDSWKNLNESIALLLATYQQVIERE